MFRTLAWVCLTAAACQDTSAEICSDGVSLLQVVHNVSKRVRNVETRSMTLHVVHGGDATKALLDGFERELQADMDTLYKTKDLCDANAKMVAENELMHEHHETKQRCDGVMDGIGAYMDIWARLRHWCALADDAKFSYVYTTLQLGVTEMFVGGVGLYYFTKEEVNSQAESEFHALTADAKRVKEADGYRARRLLEGDKDETDANDETGMTYALNPLMQELPDPPWAAEADEAELARDQTFHERETRMDEEELKHALSNQLPNLGFAYMIGIFKLPRYRERFLDVFQDEIEGLNQNVIRQTAGFSTVIVGGVEQWFSRLQFEHSSMDGLFVPQPIGSMPQTLEQSDFKKVSLKWKTKNGWTWPCRHRVYANLLYETGSPPGLYEIQPPGSTRSYVYESDD